MSGRRLTLRISLGLLLAAAAPAAQAQVPLPAQARVAGLSQAEWGTLWWQWASQFDDQDSPVTDPDGARCAAGQRGPVWFLAGTYGTASTQRRCSVPAGKHLFFPLMNFITTPSLETPNCASLQRSAKSLADRLVGLVLVVNGERIPLAAEQRQRSTGCFNLLHALPGADPVHAAADGYWVMLPPLPPGLHQIEFGGALPHFAQAVRYHLDVR